MKYLLLAFLSLALSFPLFSQWNNNSSENNLIANTMLEDISPVSISDGAGGSIIAFYSTPDAYSHNAPICLQKITSSGSITWGTTSNPIIGIENGGGADINDMVAIADGSGGVFISWPFYASNY